MIDLKEIKDGFLKSASQIPNWKELDKKELANGYLKYKDTNPALANSYISCLIVSYWNLLFSFQQSCGTSAIDNAAAYNWLIDAIERLFKYKPWLDPTAKIYNDERVIDKAMYTYMQSARTNELVANSLQKRRLNINCYSIDSLETENDSGVFTKSKEKLSVDVSIRNLIQSFIDKDDIITAVIIDIICYEIPFKNGKYDNNLVYRTIRDIGAEFYNYFVEEYNVDKDKLEKCVKKMQGYHNTYFVKYVKDKIKALKNNDMIKEFYGTN